MGFVYSMSRNLNIWGVFWTNQTKMGQSALGRWRAEGVLQVPSGNNLMLGLCSLSLLEFCFRHWFYLFLCTVVRQCYEGRRRDLEFGLWRWTTSEQRIAGY